MTTGHDEVRRWGVAGLGRAFTMMMATLRADPRPMDGIYHATFVSARMHWAMTHLIRTGLLSSEEVEQARAAARLDAENFHSGYGVVAEHGRLTNIGKALMAGAKAYMDSQR